MVYVDYSWYQLLIDTGVDLALVDPADKRARQTYLSRTVRSWDVSGGRFTPVSTAGFGVNFGLILIYHSRVYDFIEIYEVFLVLAKSIWGNHISMAYY